jgi:hypothetical protein
VKSDVEYMLGIFSMLGQKIHQVMLISTQNGRALFCWLGLRLAIRDTYAGKNQNLVVYQF